VGRDTGSIRIQVLVGSFGAVLTSLAGTWRTIEILKWRLVTLLLNMDERLDLQGS